MTAPNYSLVDLQKRVEDAESACHDYMKTLIEGFARRRQFRHDKRVPVFAFCGMGRAGKDTAAKYVCDRLELVYPESLSGIVLPFISHSIGVPPEQAWQERHEHREFWYQWCNMFRREDPTKLVTLALGRGDIVSGVRGAVELHSVCKERYVDCVIWVDNPRVPKDPTVEYGPEDCDLIISNAGGLLEYYRKLDRLIALNRPYL